MSDVDRVLFAPRTDRHIVLSIEWRPSMVKDRWLDSLYRVGFNGGPIDLVLGREVVWVETIGL